MKEVESDSDLLLQSLRDHAHHLQGRKKLTMRTRTIVLPAAVKRLKPRHTADNRHRLYD